MAATHPAPGGRCGPGTGIDKIRVLMWPAYTGQREPLQGQNPGRSRFCNFDKRRAGLRQRPEDRTDSE